MQGAANDRTIGARPTRILVVDDDRLVLATVVAGLRQAGFEVLEADNGDDAILLARNHRPRLAILDMRMQGKSGMDGHPADRAGRERGACQARRRPRPGGPAGAAGTRKPGARPRRSDRGRDPDGAAAPGPGAGAAGAARTGARRGPQRRIARLQHGRGRQPPQFDSARLVARSHIVKKNVAPLPGSDSAQMRPLCRRTMR